MTKMLALAFLPLPVIISPPERERESDRVQVEWNKWMQKASKMRLRCLYVIHNTAKWLEILWKYPNFAFYDAPNSLTLWLNENEVKSTEQFGREHIRRNETQHMNSMQFCLFAQFVIAKNEQASSMQYVKSLKTDERETNEPHQSTQKWKLCLPNGSIRWITSSAASVGRMMRRMTSDAIRKWGDLCCRWCWRWSSMQL